MKAILNLQLKSFLRRKSTIIVASIFIAYTVLLMLINAIVPSLLIGAFVSSAIVFMLVNVTVFGVGSVKLYSNQKYDVILMSKPITRTKLYWYTVISSLLILLIVMTFNLLVNIISVSLLAAAVKGVHLKNVIKSLFIIFGMSILPYLFCMSFVYILQTKVRTKGIRAIFAPTYFGLYIIGSIIFVASTISNIDKRDVLNRKEIFFGETPTLKEIAKGSDKEHKIAIGYTQNNPLVDGELTFEQIDAKSTVYTASNIFNVFNIAAHLNNWLEEFTVHEGPNGSLQMNLSNNWLVGTPVFNETNKPNKANIKLTKDANYYYIPYAQETVLLNWHTFLASNLQIAKLYGIAPVSAEEKKVNQFVGLLRFNSAFLENVDREFNEIYKEEQFQNILNKYNELMVFNDVYDVKTLETNNKQYQEMINELNLVYGNRIYQPYLSNIINAIETNIAFIDKEYPLATRDENVKKVYDELIDISKLTQYSDIVNAFKNSQFLTDTNKKQFENIFNYASAYLVSLNVFKENEKFANLKQFVLANKLTEATTIEESKYLNNDIYTQFYLFNENDFDKAVKEQKIFRYELHQMRMLPWYATFIIYSAITIALTVGGQFVYKKASFGGY